MKAVRAPQAPQRMPGTTDSAKLHVFPMHAFSLEGSTSGFSLAYPN